MNKQHGRGEGESSLKRVRGPVESTTSTMSILSAICYGAIVLYGGRGGGAATD